jgi:hypothetical protein
MRGLQLSKWECELEARRLAGKTRSRPTFRAIALASSSTMARARWCTAPVPIKGLIGTRVWRAGVERKIENRPNVAVWIV